MRDFEKNGLHIIISEDYLTKQLSKCLKNAKELTAQSKDLQKVNQSVTNMENEFAKVKTFVNTFCNYLPDFIDLLPTTKAGKFSKNQKVYLYRTKLKLSIHTQDYFSATYMSVMLESNYNSGKDLSEGELETIPASQHNSVKKYYENLFRKGITKQEDEQLKQKYGEKYKQSGNFLFLTFDDDNSNKKVKDFYFDKNFALQIKSKQKVTYLSECKVGHVYENKNGKKYLCISAKIHYSLDYSPNHLWNVCKRTYYDCWNMTYGMKYKVNNVTVDNFKELVMNSPYTNKAFPLFLLLDKEAQKKIEGCKTVQEVTLRCNDWRGDDFAGFTYAGQMVKDLGKMLDSVPEKCVIQEDSSNYIEISTMETWIKKDFNRYHKLVEEYDSEILQWD